MLVWSGAKAAFRQIQTLEFKLDKSLRRLKPQKRSQPLARRPDTDLRWATDELLIGPPLLLDTCVYFDVLKGHTPKAVDDLLESRLCEHSSISLAELTHVFGRLDPAHPDTAKVLKPIQDTINDIPSHRLSSPDETVWGEAGILAGELFRRSGASKGTGQERKFLNDALIYLHARARGAMVLTGNVTDFDFLSQIYPAAEVIMYQHV